MDGIILLEHQSKSLSFYKGLWCETDDESKVFKMLVLESVDADLEGSHGF